MFRNLFIYINSAINFNKTKNFKRYFNLIKFLNKIFVFSKFENLSLHSDKILYNNYKTFYRNEITDNFKKFDRLSNNVYSQVEIRTKIIFIQL